MAQAKELLDMKRTAEQQGWSVEHNGGHMKWYPPDGEFIVTSATPSDSNIIKTIRKDLENAGLILDRQQMKRLQKAIRNGDTEVQIQAIPAPKGRNNIWDCSDEEIFAAIEVHQPRVWEGIKNSSVRKNVAAAMYRNWGSRGPDGDFPTDCATCDKSFVDPMGLAMHIYRQETDHVPRWTFAVEDDPEVAEPDGFIPCPHCDDLFLLDALGTHVDDCSERPDAPLVAPEPDPEPQPAPEPDSHSDEQDGQTLAPTQEPISTSGEITDDELYGLLEIVLDGPVMVTRESLSAINDWMDATRRLLQIRAESVA